MKPHCKNHKVVKKIESMEVLLECLYTRKSIYFGPANKILPTAFFAGWAWRKSGALEKYLKSGAFYYVVPRDQFMVERIRKELSKCPKIVIRMSDGAKMIQL